MFLFRIRSEGYRRSNGNRKAGNGGEKTCLRSLNVVSILVTASGAKGRITFGSRFATIFSLRLSSSFLSYGKKVTIRLIDRWPVLFFERKKKKEKKGNNWNYRDSFSLYLFFSLFTTLVLQSMEFSGKRLEISEKREIYRLFFLSILIFYTYIFTIQKIILNCPAYTFLSKSTILCHEAFKEISNLTRRIIIEEQLKESFFD